MEWASLFSDKPRFRGWFGSKASQLSTAVGFWMTCHDWYVFAMIPATLWNLIITSLDCFHESLQNFHIPIIDVRIFASSPGCQRFQSLSQLGQGSHGTLGDGSVPSVRPLLAIFGLRLVEASEVWRDGKLWLSPWVSPWEYQLGMDHHL